jgi:POT family proton-dependent oligopeptide transporter
METHGLPNDMLLNLNPISVVIILPLIDKFMYPYMKKIGLPSTATVRMTVGFVFVSASMAVAAGLQLTCMLRTPASLRGGAAAS